MSSFMDLFSGANFRVTIQKYCSQNNWRPSDINDRRAILKFDMKSGRTQTLYIIKFDTTLEFSVPSMINFSSEDDIPHYISTILMKRNRERKIGFWCIEIIGNKQTYSAMHNAEMKLMDSDYFALVIQALISDCDEFEGTIIKILNS
jgi:hypothetical protein